MKQLLVLLCVFVPFLLPAQTNGETKKDTINLLKPSPLIIVDGIKKSNINIQTIDLELKPENIEKIEVIKSKDATLRYGDEGKNGVVLITTKKKKKTGEPH